MIAAGLEQPYSRTQYCLPHCYYYQVLPSFGLLGPLALCLLDVGGPPFIRVALDFFSTIRFLSTMMSATRINCLADSLHCSDSEIECVATSCTTKGGIYGPQPAATNADLPAKKGELQGMTCSHTGLDNSTNASPAILDDGLVHLEFFNDDFFEFKGSDPSAGLPVVPLDLDSHLSVPTSSSDWLSNVQFDSSYRDLLLQDPPDVSPDGCVADSTLPKAEADRDAQELLLHRRPECKSTFGTSHELGTLSQESALEPWPDLECEKICSRGSTTTLASSAEDEEIVTGKTSYRCSVCHRGFETARDLDGHSKTSSHKAYQCPRPQCQKSYSRRDVFLRHRATHKAGGHICPYCSKVSKRRDHFLQHLKSCQSDKEDQASNKSVFPYCKRRKLLIECS